jgi:ribosome-associated translation inhibitor RaiA
MSISFEEKVFLRAVNFKFGDSQYAFIKESAKNIFQHNQIKHIDVSVEMLTRYSSFTRFEARGQLKNTHQGKVLYASAMSDDPHRAIQLMLMRLDRQMHKRHDKRTSRDYKTFFHAKNTNEMLQRVQTKQCRLS